MTSRATLFDLFRLATVLASLAAAACDGGYTVHPIIDESATPMDAKSLEGLWIAGEGNDYWALRIAAVPVASRTCPEAAMQVWEESSSLDDPPMLQGRFCLTEIAGQAVAELETAAEPPLYQHFLVRVERSRIAVCGGVSVWATFKGSQGDDTPKFSLEGLDYTVRRRGEAENVFIISGPEELRAALARNLPRLAALCDEERQDEGGPTWVVFQRVSPPPDEEPAPQDSPSSRSPETG
jgi:hypothetical protein